MWQRISFYALGVAFGLAISYVEDSRDGLVVSLVSTLAYIALMSLARFLEGENETS